MTEHSEHRVGVWVGSFGDAGAFEAYLAPTYTGDGNREEAAFEREFGIRLKPDGREAEFNLQPADGNVTPSVQSFSYVEQFRAPLERDLIDAGAAGCDSLLLAYDYEGENRIRCSERMMLIGIYVMIQAAGKLPRDFVG